MSVKFEDNRLAVQSAIAEIAFRVLNEIGGEFASQTAINTRVDTGDTKNSWRYRVAGSMMAQQFEAVIGSDRENAIWEEFGTGEYALNGDGRKGGWRYKDESGYWHYTKGKTPSRPLQRAYVALKDQAISYCQNEFAKGMK